MHTCGIIVHLSESPIECGGHGGRQSEVECANFRNIRNSFTLKFK